MLEKLRIYFTDDEIKEAFAEYIHECNGSYVKLISQVFVGMIGICAALSTAVALTNKAYSIIYEKINKKRKYVIETEEA